MLFNLYKKSLVTLLLIISASITLFAQGNGTVKPYNAQAVALKGQTNTDITLTFFTNNASKFPIPAELKKLQIKIRNQAGDVSYIHNAKALSLNGNVYTTSIVGPQNHNILEYQAHIKTAATKNEEIITGTVTTKLYSNLKVESVTAPAEKKINEPFNLEAFITETNLETSATCTVSLYKEGSLVASYPNVAVAAGGNASVVFGNLTHNAIGAQNYSVVIENAVPGDYNTSDNSKSAVVNFINPVSNVAQSNYWLYYERTNNYVYDYRGVNSYSGQEVYHYNQTGDWENLQYGVNNYVGLNTNSNLPISASYKIETSDNRVISGTFENIPTNYYYYYYYQYFYAFDPVNFVQFNGYIDTYGYVQAYIYRYRSNYVYYYNELNGYNYYYENHDPLSSFINENSQLKVSLVATYDNYSWGGGAILNLNPAQNYSNTSFYQYYDYNYGYINQTYTNSYSQTYNYSNGLTDINYLPKIIGADTHSIAKDLDVPATFSIDQNYPNPFNPTTTIKYAIPEASFVTLKVFNITGEEVATLVNRQISAGFHSVNFDAKGLASGTYIYRIQAGNYVKTYKMLLMK